MVKALRAADPFREWYGFQTHPTGSSATPDPLSSFTLAHAGTNSQGKHAASELLSASFTSRKHAVPNMLFFQLFPRIYAHPKFTPIQPEGCFSCCFLRDSHRCGSGNKLLKIYPHHSTTPLSHSSTNPQKGNKNNC